MLIINLKISAQVQGIVGMNCTCDEGLTSEMITNATMRLLEENMEEAKKMRQYSSLSDNRLPKKTMGKKKSNKKGGRRKMWSPRSPKSI